MRTYATPGTYIHRVEDLTKFIDGKIKEIEQMQFELHSKERSIDGLKKDKINLEETKAELLARMALR